MLLVVILIVCITLLFANLWFDWRADKMYENYWSNTNKVKKLSAMVTTPQKSDTIRVKQMNTNQKSGRFWRKEANNFGTNGEKPWFMTNGTLRPRDTLLGDKAVWPEQSNGDRIVNQLMFLPKHYNPFAQQLKKIVLYLGRGGWSDLPMGRTKFISDKCPVDRCYLSADASDAMDADALFFKERFQWPKHKRPSHQIWILFLLECPLHTQLFRNLGTGVFNWTATYRHDSDIVAPYEKFVPFGQKMHKKYQNKVCDTFF